MITVKVSKFFLEYFMVEGEQLNAVLVKKGLPYGSKLHCIEYRDPVITFYFRDREEVEKGIIKIGDVQEITMEFEAVNNDTQGLRQESYSSPVF